MNKVQRNAVIGGIGGMIIASAVNYVKVIREERKKREQIELDLERELTAMAIAKARIEERMEHNPERYHNINDIMTDFEFQTIVENDKLR